jgi:hypothetical protein
MGDVASPTIEMNCDGNGDVDNGDERDGVACDGVACDGVECDGVECDGNAVGGARERLLYREIRLSVLECEDGMTCL